MSQSGSGRRAAIVAGLRTPFVKMGTSYRDLSARELGALVVRELVERSGIDPRWIQQVVYGQVVPTVSAPNIAREVVFGANLPRSIEAYSVSRACATSYQSTANVVDAIQQGLVDCAISGGADSASDVPITVSKRLQKALVALSNARSAGAKLRAFRGLSPKDLLPEPPALTEPSTGLTMGESAEKMAKENRIGREEQDAFAHRSHVRAAAAWREGRFDGEVMPVYVPPRYEVAVTRDGTVRDDSQLDKYASLRPAFDRRWGTITAGNSSPLTDGASALLLMSEERARAEGLEILGVVRSYAFAALDPRGQMLMGPSYATPIALERAGVSLSDLDLIDMHEAFAAQVLSNLQAFASKEFAARELGRSEPIGEVDMDRFNVNGGSIALGHPFAATGARQITQTLQELKRRGGGLALCTACAAGGLGAAMVLEAAS
ncbi:MAG: acetyl-CoA C-acyltransferase FadI [Planctomycetota bacterium]|nr:MAG: acetyl-CoA C-acyltransferase FadI [Planctomycetota bacterium]